MSVASDWFRPLIRPFATAGRLTSGPMGSPQLGSSTWLLHLRFFAVAGQFVTIATAHLWVELPLRWSWLYALVGITAATNVVYWLWLRQQPDSEPSSGDAIEMIPIVATLLMALDLVTLTAMLHLTGGVDNPFSYFFFVNLAVGGVTIASGLVWTLTATAIAGYGFLLLYAPPLEIFGGAIANSAPWQPLARIVAFATCSTVVTYYVTRTAGQSRRRHGQLMEMQTAKETSRRLQGLTTLAAGAAHELATPLSTIDVVVRELSHHLEACEKPPTVVHDLRLIDGELERCRGILARMRGEAGNAAAERFRQTTVGDLIDAALEGVRQPHRVDVADAHEDGLLGDIESTPLWVPTETVAQAIRNLIHNALDASDSDTRVRLDACVDECSVRFDVTDHGQGMTDEVLARIAEPFFTTKEPGRGIGLGLFLTRNVISQLGGEMSFQSDLGRGTVASVRLPRQRNAMLRDGVSR